MSSVTLKAADKSGSTPTVLSGITGWTGRGVVAVIAAASSGTSTVTLTSSGTETWAAVASTATDYGSRRRIEWFQSNIIPTNGTVLTFTMSGSFAELMYAVLMANDYDDSSLIQDVGSAFTASGPTSLSSSTVGTIGTDELVVLAGGFENGGDGLAPAAGTTQISLTNGGSDVRSLLIGTSTTDDTPGITWSTGSYSAGCAAIRLSNGSDGPSSGGATITGDGTPASQASAASGTAERELPGSGTPAAQASATTGASSRGLDSTGTPAAQAAATTGAAERVLLCSGELISAASSTTGTAAIQVKLTLTSAAGRELRDENGALVASLSNIAFEWYDKDTDTEGDPDVSGTFNTDASGEATIQLAGSSLTAGQFGLLVLEHPTDNTIRGIYRIPVS